MCSVFYMQQEVMAEDEVKPVNVFRFPAVKNPEIMPLWFCLCVCLPVQCHQSFCLKYTLRVQPSFCVGLKNHIAHFFDILLSEMAMMAAFISFSLMYLISPHPITFVFLPIMGLKQ